VVTRDCLKGCQQVSALYARGAHGFSGSYATG
jgi:hypothetical protein